MRLSGRVLKKVLLYGLCACVCFYVAETIYEGFFPDVSFIAPKNQCAKNLHLYLGGQQVSCPLAKDIKGYETFPVSDLNDARKRFVVAADKGLFHRQCIGFRPNGKRFAMVLLDNDRAVRWVGKETDYQKALERAHASPEGRLAEQFFKSSWEYRDIMNQIEVWSNHE